MMSMLPVVFCTTTTTSATTSTTTATKTTTTTTSTTTKAADATEAQAPNTKHYWCIRANGHAWNCGCIMEETDTQPQRHTRWGNERVSAILGPGLCRGTVF